MTLVHTLDKSAGPRRADALPVASGALRRDIGFVLGHVWLPLIALIVVLAAATIGHGDQWLADRIYAWGGRAWVLRDGFVTDALIHVAGRDFSIGCWLLLLAAWVTARVRPDWRFLRRPLAYLLVAVLLSTLLVAWIKAWSNMDCPWDLARYGGSKPFVGLFALRPLGLPRGACMPAGHASGGYAWMALYFFFAVVRPRWRRYGLAIGVGLGLLFGFSQQLRGAHFLSHDAWTAGICWATALALYLLFWRTPEPASDVRVEGASA